MAKGKSAAKPGKHVTLAWQAGHPGAQLHLYRNVPVKRARTVQIAQAAVARQLGMTMRMASIEQTKGIVKGKEELLLPPGTFPEHFDAVMREFGKRKKSI